MLSDVKRFQPYIGVIPGCEEYALSDAYDVYEPCMKEGAGGSYVGADIYDRDIQALEETIATISNRDILADAYVKLSDDNAKQAITITRLRETLGKVGLFLRARAKSNEEVELPRYRPLYDAIDWIDSALTEEATNAKS